MEVAHLKPFFDSTILFSLMYNNYEKDLKTELWLCHKNMNLSMDEILNMPISDRKFYIYMHNKGIEEEKQKMKNVFGKKH